MTHNYSLLFIYFFAALGLSLGLWMAANLFVTGNTNEGKNSSKELIFMYFLLKSFAILILIALMPSIFGRGYFDYSDFKAYSNCNFRSENSFFSVLICLIDVDKISDFRAISLALIFNTFKDLLIISIVIKQKILKPKSILFFVILLSLHPYLAIYHAKLSTSIFASLGVAIIFYIISSSKHQNIILDLSLITISGLRNTTVGIIAPYYIWEIIRQSIGIIKGKKNLDYYFLKNIISLSTVIFILMLSGEYIFNFVHNANRYSLDMSFFLQFVDTSFKLLDIVIAFLLVIFSHLIVLLGFREAAFTQFPDFFIPLNSIAYFHIFVGIGLCLAHGFGFFSFMKSFLFKDKRYIILIFTLVPTLFSVAHLRYFLPFIPLSLIGLAILLDNKLLLKRKD